MKSVLLGIVMLTTLSLCASAQKSVAEFTLMNVTNDQNVSLNSYRNSKAVVVVITSNYCPYSKLYEERLINLQTSLIDQNVHVILINPNSPDSSPEDSEALMAQRAKEQKYPFPYLSDKEMVATRMLNARKTPEAFVLTPQSSGFDIEYQGAIDDNPQSSGEVRSQYLKDAINSILVGQKPTSDYQRPTGCMIRN